MPVYMLLDNGSRRAEATLALRRLAQALSRHSGETVHPVSLQHADAIPAEALEGRPAWTLEAFLRHQHEQGEREFVGLPLFFGTSRALTSFIPDRVAALRESGADLDLRLAPVTYPLPEGDPRLAAILHEHIEAARQGRESARVVLVDHGSPSTAITEVRVRLARELAQRHGQVVDQAVMERREGPQYDFNGELLAQWLERQAQQGVREVIIAMQFFLPGRHAGPCGDVDEICRSVAERHPGLSYTITPLVGEHPQLLSLLKARMDEV